MSDLFPNVLFSVGMVVGTALAGLILGMSMIAFSQIMLAIREIALNTRKKEQLGEYRILEIMAILNNVSGWIIIVASIVIPIALMIAYFARR